MAMPKPKPKVVTHAETMSRPPWEFSKGMNSYVSICTEIEGARVRSPGIAHPKADGANAWPVNSGEGLGEAFRLGVDDEVGVALAIERNPLRAVPRDGGEAHAFE